MALVPTSPEEILTNLRQEAWSREGCDGLGIWGDKNLRVYCSMIDEDLGLDSNRILWPLL